MSVTTSTSGRCLSFDLASLFSSRLAFLSILQLLNLARSVGCDSLGLKSLVDGFNLLGVLRHVLSVRVGIVIRGFRQLVVSGCLDEELINSLCRRAE